MQIAEPEDYGKKMRKKKKDDNVPNGDSVPKRKKRKDESKKISEFFKGKSYKAKRSDSEELGESLSRTQFCTMALFALIISQNKGKRTPRCFSPLHP